MIIASPTHAIELTAAEMRVLAGAHDQFAAESDACGLADQAARSVNRADQLRRLADALNPDDGLADVLV